MLLHLQWLLPSILHGERQLPPPLPVTITTPSCRIHPRLVPAALELLQKPAAVHEFLLSEPVLRFRRRQPVVKLQRCSGDGVWYDDEGRSG